MRKIIGIGETVYDIIFKNNLPQTAVPGGSTFNAMISLGRTAAKKGKAEVVMVTETGSDHVGDIIANFMKDNGVGTKSVTRNPGTQAHISLAFLDDNNDAQYEFYKDHAHANLDASKVENIDFQQDDVVLFGSFFAINPVIREYTHALLTKAKAAGAIIYYDINFRKNYRKDRLSLLPTIEENCSLSDFVKGSSEDFEYLFDNSNPEFVYSEKIKKFCPNLIVTQGARSTEFFRSDGNRFYFPVEQIETVSTIGAGDNFNAGFIYGLLNGGFRKEDCLNIELPALTDIIRTATRFSANVCRSFNNYVDNDFINVLSSEIHEQH